MNDSATLKLLAVAGEPSGDAHGGELLAGLKQRLPRLRVMGVGGPRMVQAGLEPLAPFSALQVHGLVEVVRHLPRLYRILWRLGAAIDLERPAAVLLIDYPGFNLKLARLAKRKGVPVLYYSGPQIWAWRGGRIRKIAAAVAKMMVLFPFETALYQRAGVNTEFFGHPLVGSRAGPDEVTALRARIEGADYLPLVAVMPGSRPGEVERILPPLLRAVRLIEEAGYRARWVLPVAPSLEAAWVRRLTALSGAPVQVVEDGFLPLLSLADLAVSASGTATLQLAMAGVPFVVVYRVAWLSFFLAKRFAYVRHLAMVNILAGREIVPELLQGDFTPERVRDVFLRLARDPDWRQRMRQDLAQVTSRLGEPGAYGRAAQAIADFLTASRSPSGA